MSRDRYGAWLAHADDRTVSTALCTAGLAASYAPDLLRAASGPQETAERIVLRWTAQGSPVPARWTDPALLPTFDPATASAAPLAESWAWLNGRLGGYPTRLALDPATDVGVLTWVADRLGYEVNASPFVPLPPDGRVPRPWPFPLRIGVLAGPAGAALREQVGAARRGGTTGWRSRLLELVDIGRERVSCDLLVLSGGPAAAAAAVGALREVRSQVVLVVGEAGPSTAGTDVPAIVAATGAWAVRLAAPDDVGAWVIEFCRQLTHNLTVDEAFLRSERPAPGLLFARPDALALQRIARRATATVAAIDAAMGGPEIRGPDGPPPGRPLPDQVVRAKANADTARERLAYIVRRGRYEFESGDASDIDMAMRDTAALTEFADASRYVRAAITAADEPGIVLDAFRAGTTHTVRVDIGTVTPQQLIAPTPFDQGTAASPQRLTVVLTEPTLLPDPPVGEIDLPVTGASTMTEFTLATRPDTVEVDARILVLSGNRLVQTARLPRYVGPGVPATPDTEVATPEIQIAPLSQGLQDRRTFDLALVVDGVDEDDRTRATTATAVAGTATASIRLGDYTVHHAVDLIAGRLAQIVDQPDDYGAIDAPGSVALLTYLAIHGSMMCNALVHDTAGMDEVLAQSRYVQVTSGQPDAWFPLEFAYDFPAPEKNAPLCPGAPDALASGDIDTTCPAVHDGSTVCPFGFWGISRVIERHATPRSAELRADFLMTSGPGPDRRRIVLGSSVVAASQRVDGIVTGSIDRVVGTLTRHAPTRNVVDWAQWRDAVDGGPSLLMLLPHTVYDAEMDLYGLEIGADARLMMARITEALMPVNPFLTVLLGCDTARAGSLRYEQFPSVLRGARAEVVVATLTEIFGRHAAPMAQSFADELWAACRDEPVGVGEVMVILRRRMLARGIPAVLALTAFGDADWLICRERP